MRSAASPAAARDVDGMHAAIERFLKASRQPCLLEPGEELLPLKEGSYSVDRNAARLTIQAWSDTRNLTRRIVGLGEERRGRLELVVEHFARSVGPPVPDRHGAARFAGDRAAAVEGSCFASVSAAFSRASFRPGS